MYFVGDLVKIPLLRTHSMKKNSTIKNIHHAKEPIFLVTMLIGKASGVDRDGE